MIFTTEGLLEVAIDFYLLLSLIFVLFYSLPVFCHLLRFYFKDDLFRHVCYIPFR